jgi:hypothetical protein
MWHNILLVFSQKFYTFARETRHRKLILGLVKPLVDHFVSRRVLNSFHFFYEGNRLEIRLELSEDIHRNHVNNLFRKYVDNVADLIDTAQSGIADYQPEVKEYGIDGWEIAKKMFEYGSRLSIALVDPRFQRGHLLREDKLIHCILNSCNYDTPSELMFHIYRAIERQVMTISQERGVKPEDVNKEEAIQRVMEHLTRLRDMLKSSRKD